MDQMDLKILQMLQENSRASLKEIANVTYLSSPAISNRISKLEKEGYIGKYMTVVDLKN